MRVYKTIKGEKFPYHVYFISNTMQARVRYYMGDEEQVCKISDDFKYIILPEHKEFTHYIDGVYYPVKKLKLNHHQQIDAKFYNDKK